MCRQLARALIRISRPCCVAAAQQRRSDAERQSRSAAARRAAAPQRRAHVRAAPRHYADTRGDAATQRRCDPAMPRCRDAATPRRRDAATRPRGRRTHAGATTSPPSRRTKCLESCSFRSPLEGKRKEKLLAPGSLTRYAICQQSRSATRPVRPALLPPLAAAALPARTSCPNPPGCLIA